MQLRVGSLPLRPFSPSFDISSSAFEEGFILQGFARIRQFFRRRQARFSLAKEPLRPLFLQDVASHHLLETLGRLGRAAAQLGAFQRERVQRPSGAMQHPFISVRIGGADILCGEASLERPALEGGGTAQRFVSPIAAHQLIQILQALGCVDGTDPPQGGLSLPM